MGIIKKGDRFRCIKTLKYKERDLWYKKGKIYRSDEDGCITDEEGDTFHGWSWSIDKQPKIDPFSEYFTPYISNKRRGYGRYTRIREEV